MKKIGSFILVLLFLGIVGFGFQNCNPKYKIAASEATDKADYAPRSLSIVQSETQRSIKILKIVK